MLGLRIGGEAGVVFARGSADATVGVTVTWRPPVEGGEPADDTR